MTSTAAVLNQLVMLLLIALLGFGFRRSKVMTDSVIKGINQIVLRAAWPAMIMSTTQKDCTADNLPGFLTVIGLTTVILMMLLLICFRLSRRLKAQRDAALFAFLSIFPNAGFVGMPIIEAVYGAEGVLFMAAFLVGFNLILWTEGVILFHGTQHGWLKAMLNPGLAASILGTILFLLKISLPSFLLSGMKQLGALTTPLSMLLLGARIDRIDWKQMRNPNLWYSIAIKLVVVPILFFLAARLPILNSKASGTMILCASMPAASAAQLFAERYDSDVTFAVTGIAISMLCCIITIPIATLCIA